MRGFVHHAGTALTWGLLAIAVVAFLFLAIGPRVFGYQTYTMLTGSMAPLIDSGDVVVTVPTDVKDVEVGDIITYHIPIDDHRVETHRIVEVIEKPGGATAVKTKGDANNGVDPWTAVLEGDHVDRHAFTIPHLGTVIRTFQQPMVLNALMYGAPAILVIAGLAAIWRKGPESDPKPTAKPHGKLHVSGA